MIDDPDPGVADSPNAKPRLIRRGPVPMSGRLTIALDAMGGDIGPDVVVPAALSYLSRTRDTELILVGDQDRIRSRLGGDVSRRIRVQHATQTVAMDESPSKALRNKKDSSMRVAIDLVKSGEAHACVSAGNTGALMATARFVLKTLPYVDRPGIQMALVPGFAIPGDQPETIRIQHRHTLPAARRTPSRSQGSGPPARTNILRAPYLDTVADSEP